MGAPFQHDPYEVEELAIPMGPVPPDDDVCGGQLLPSASVMGAPFQHAP